MTASQVLTHFLFPPAKQYGMVNKLSGGEKKRLQLMRVLMKNPNYLILDEPTNDLDIDTLNVLEDFLLNFPGILMLVSHDRYLIDRLTEQLFIFEGDGNVHIYSGNYTDYRLEQEEPKKPVKSGSKAEIIISEPEIQKRKLSFKEEKELQGLETETKELEKQVDILTSTLNSGITDHTQLSEIALQIKDLKDDIDNKTMRWLELIDLKESI
jgi:ATP-binding cassette subfamily F protein uup